MLSYSIEFRKQSEREHMVRSNTHILGFSLFCNKTVKHEKKTKKANEVDILILQQESSIDAMKIARMISPRFQDKVEHIPQIKPNSKHEARLHKLMIADRIGSYYH